MLTRGSYIIFYLMTSLVDQVINGWLYFYFRCYNVHVTCVPIILPRDNKQSGLMVCVIVYVWVSWYINIGGDLIVLILANSKCIHRMHTRNSTQSISIVKRLSSPEQNPLTVT